MRPWADPVLFELGPVAVHWYGLILAASMLAATGTLSWLLRRQGCAEPWPEAAALAGTVLPAGFLGARLAFVCQNLATFLAEPARILAIWDGGLSIHGALAGGLLALAWRERSARGFLARADQLLTVLPLAQAVGRWGNFINRELLGYPTRLPWAVVVEPAYRPAAYAGSATFHPVFLYESAACLALFGLLWQRAARPRATAGPGRLRPRTLPPGSQAAAYLMGYGLIRFAVEFVRIGEPFLAGLTLAQWVSLLMVAGGWGVTRWAGAVRGTTPERSG
ncbi:MAG TPA: prolipoprotein diacylglyceryl transferase, partial [Limnochorda sp.]